MIANKYKILVIEDEDNINNLLKALLETNGYQVITAKNCQNGYTLFTSQTGFGNFRFGASGS